MSWQASTDDTSVTDYVLHRGSSAGFLVASATAVGTTAGTSAVDLGRPVGDAYYQVARDAGGNVSAASDAVLARV